LTERNATYPIEPGFDLEALERTVRETVAGPVYDFFAGGAEGEVTLAGNRAAWDEIWIRPQALRGVGQGATESMVLGTRVAAPILVAPIGFQRLLHNQAELATAQGSAAAGSIMIVSTRATATIEDISKAAPDHPRWFQLYVLRDRGWTKELAQRAAAAGYGALVLTVDAPVLGRRLRDERNAFALPPDVRMANASSSLPIPPEEIGTYAGSEHDPAIGLEVIEWVRGLVDLPVVVKGILRGDDAAQCVDRGAAAIVVSNHGGRQLDGAVPTAIALREVVARVEQRAEVYVDGAISRGTDVIKAMALGASAVLVGRPVMWGLATGGAEGVADVLRGMRSELARALVLCQVPSVSDVSDDLIYLPER
jgi:4-hydroxymandelate oxidase